MNKCKKKNIQVQNQNLQVQSKCAPTCCGGWTARHSWPKSTCTAHLYFSYFLFCIYFFEKILFCEWCFIFAKHITYSKILLHRLKIPDGLNDDIMKWTNRLGFHACEDNIEHLRECGFSCGLINEVAARQVDVVTGPYSQEHSAFVNLNVWRCHNCQQGLDRNNQRSRLSKEHTMQSEYSYIFIFSILGVIASWYSQLSLLSLDQNNIIRINWCVF